MTQEEYRALRREADRKLKLRLRYGTIIYVASELFSENGIDMIRRFKPYRAPPNRPPGSSNLCAREKICAPAWN